jgi:hypothetical protein
MLTLKKEFKAEELFDVCFPDYEQDPDEEGVIRLRYLHLESKNPHGINPTALFDIDPGLVTNVDLQLVNRLLIKEGFSDPKSYEYNFLDSGDREVASDLYIWERPREEAIQSAVDKLFALPTEEERIVYTKAYTGLDDLELEDNAFQPKARSSRRFGR